VWNTDYCDRWSHSMSVCQAFCHVASCGFAVQKWLNGWYERFCLGWDSCDPRNNVLNRGRGFLHRFDATLAKLLWPKVVLTNSKSVKWVWKNTFAKSAMFCKELSGNSWYLDMAPESPNAALAPDGVRNPSLQWWMPQKISVATRTWSVTDYCRAEQVAHLVSLINY